MAPSRLLMRVFMRVLKQYENIFLQEELSRIFPAFASSWADGPQVTPTLHIARRLKYSEISSVKLNIAGRLFLEFVPDAYHCQSYVHAQISENAPHSAINANRVVLSRSNAICQLFDEVPRFLNAWHSRSNRRDQARWTNWIKRTVHCLKT
jgi:hypothetical protein